MFFFAEARESARGAGGRGFGVRRTGTEVEGFLADFFGEDALGGGG